MSGFGFADSFKTFKWFNRCAPFKSFDEGRFQRFQWFQPFNRYLTVQPVQIVQNSLP